MLEITESAVARDGESALARLRTLNALGVQLAIDDFGTGSSSPDSLERFPVDVLKIDKAFVGHVGVEESRRSLARMIVALGDALSFRAIAEGVSVPSRRRCRRWGARLPRASTIRVRYRPRRSRR